jgi:hypothetical protein
MRVNSLPLTTGVCSHPTYRRASKYVKLTKPSLQRVDVFVHPPDTQDVCSAGMVFPAHLSVAQ